MVHALSPQRLEILAVLARAHPRALPALWEAMMQGRVRLQPEHLTSTTYRYRKAFYSILWI